MNWTRFNARLVSSALTLLATLALGAVVLSGCHQGEPVELPPQVFRGVKVDLPKLQLQFATADPEAQAVLSRIVHNLNYGQYPTITSELDDLARRPNLTDAQRQALTTVRRQVQELIAQTGSGK